MIDLIKNKVDELQSVCKKHSVESLFLFGSAAKNEFISDKSDLDFVVEFKKDLDPINYADNFFSLMDDLKIIFNKEIDLLSYRALKNEIMISEIDNSKVQLYAA